MNSATAQVALGVDGGDKRVVDLILMLFLSTKSTDEVFTDALSKQTVPIR